jgi:hypothetical protein
MKIFLANSFEIGIGSFDPETYVDEGHGGHVEAKIVEESRVKSRIVLPILTNSIDLLDGVVEPVAEFQIQQSII